MSERIVEIFLPEISVGDVRRVIARHCRRFWQETVPGDKEKFSCLVQHRGVEGFLADLDEAFGGLPDFTVLVTRLEAVIPAMPEATLAFERGRASERPPTRIERFFSRDRISTDELLDDIDEKIHVTPNFLLMLSLSAIIAALGMRSGQTAVVIGAMVIAPLLGPVMGMALAATLGDARLARRSVSTIAVGASLALVTSFVVGLLTSIDPGVPELHARTIVQPADIILALACGAAGVLAFSQGASLSLVGVMIAVALVPPLSAAGVLAGSGHAMLATNALFLFAVNLTCVNLAGIVMFLVQGLPPKTWRLTAGVTLIWAGILLLLFALMIGRIGFGIAAMEGLRGF